MGYFIPYQVKKKCSYQLEHLRWDMNDRSTIDRVTFLIVSSIQVSQLFMLLSSFCRLEFTAADKGTFFSQVVSQEFLST